MSSMNLIDSIFRRIYEIANTSGFAIKELPSGCISFCSSNPNKDIVIAWSTWEWENKEQFLVGNQYAMSLFEFVVNEYIPYYSHLNYKCYAHKCYTNFIDLCKTLKGCKSIEELAIKIELMGI